MITSLMIHSSPVLKKWQEVIRRGVLIGKWPLQRCTKLKNERERERWEGDPGNAFP